MANSIVADDDSQNSLKYANQHIPRFLESKSSTDAELVLQQVSDGSKLTASNLLDDDVALTLANPILVSDTPRSIGMQVPTSKKKNEVFTVRDVMNVVGQHYPVSVIDVALQEELSGWTMQDLVDYFEDETRNKRTEKQKQSKRPQRAAAARAVANTKRPKILNQISMEFSKTPLHRMVSSPQFVRDLDWIDNAWPAFQKQKGQYPVVQYYCLTSTAGCYTDFHIDFGGSSVWYHILNGQKQFILIPPTRENLQAYEDWLCHANQSQIFFPDMLSPDSVLKVTLQANQTLFIPTGWIHAVYTPVDSVVIGGNFLHGLQMDLQLQIYCIETRAKVQERFRFPHFCALQYYAAGFYLQKLRKGTIAKCELDGIPSLVTALKTWWKMHTKQDASSSISPAGAATYAAKRSDCVSVEDMIDDLQSEYDRSVKSGIRAAPEIATNATKVVSPKLRLKIKGAGSSPVIGYTSIKNSPEASETGEKETQPGANKFRIVIPHSSTYALAAAATTKRKRREDVDGITVFASNDEEWKPSGGGGKNRTSVSPPLKTTSASSHVAAAKKKKVATTSRQRLMKRFR